jgi:hypothetical protein
MKRYLAFDGINGDHEEFDTIEEAREWLEDCFLSPGEGYHPDFQSCKIYQLAETVECEVVDKKENYKYMDEDDIPEGDNESQAWPYSTDFDEIWKHKFVADKMMSERLREELIRYIKWYGGFNYENMTDEMLVNEYLNTREK